jgi:hypothetical protein
MDKDKNKKMETENSTSLGISNKNQEIISFFEKDSGFVFVYKKTEKLVTAIYMVTNLFSDDEPIKWTLRKKGGDILSFILGYKNIILSQYKDFSDDIKTKVLEVVSLLEVASRSGLVSFMNFSILEEEFANLIKTIDSYNVSNKELQANNLSKSFFYVPDPEPTLRDDNQNIGGSRRYEFSHKEVKVSENFVKDINIISDKSLLKRTNRQDSIISLLKKKKDLNIKDIASVIKGCSEKTIQRELISLISAGVVKKTGERRWSKYSLLEV